MSVGQTISLLCRGLTQVQSHCSISGTGVYENTSLYCYVNIIFHSSQAAPNLTIVVKSCRKRCVHIKIFPTGQRRSNIRAQ